MAFEKDHCHEVLVHGWHENQWEVLEPDRRYCNCLEKIWRGSSNAEKRGDRHVRFSGGIFGNCWQLECKHCCYSCQEYLHFERGCLENCRPPSGQEEIYFRQGKITSSCLPSPLWKCKHLTVHLAELPRALGGLGPITLLGTLIEGLSQMSRLQDSHCPKLTRGGQAILSQGESLHQGKDFLGNLEAPLLLSLWPRSFPARLQGNYMQGRNRSIVPFSLT